MALINPYLFLFSAVALGACVSLSAQTEQSIPSSHVKVIPPAALNPTGIFDIDNPRAAASYSIRVLSEDEMTREDHDLVANAESSIQERAGVENLEFNEEGWSYHQLVCSALPKHLFLRFTRDDGTRQMSMFSAAIPRDGNGRVRVVPIVRKGYSLFSPAPIGALTIAAFNRIRAEEGEGASADWLGTGLCYAALAGANPELGHPATAGIADPPPFIPPTLVVTSGGGAVIHFVDVSVASKPMQWSMTFDSRGKLVKATHNPASVANSVKHAPGVVDFGEAKP